MAHMTLGARLICALTILTACSDPSTLETGRLGPEPETPAPEPETPAPDPGPALPRSAALVSSSISQPAASNAMVVGGTAYVSMVPGTDPNGRRVAIRNLRGGASATSAMLDGGFDPLPVEAVGGDTLLITVVHLAGDSTRTYGVVPLISRPTVVRTSPAGGRTDVPLNCLVLVVFNQPMDSASLTVALQLQHQGAGVPGSVSVESSGGVILSGRFVPDSLLEPLSTYEFSVSTAAQSPDGTSLGAPLTVEFTTQASASPTVSGLTFVREAAVFVSGSDGSAPVALMTNAARPAWSRDGTRIAFSRPAGYSVVKWQLCIAREDGSDVRCVIGENDGDVVAGPSWSPDGTTVAFGVYSYDCPSGKCGNGGYFSSLLLLNTVTMTVTTLNTPEVWSLSWSPDGREIAVALYGVGTYGRGALGIVTIVGPNGAALRYLAASLGSYSVREVVWSPDGSKLGLSLLDENACPWYCVTAIGVVNADGTQLKLLDRGGTSADLYLWGPAWTPDGTRLAYTVSRGDTCYFDFRVPCGSDIAAAGVDDGRIALLMPAGGTPTWRR